MKIFALPHTGWLAITGVDAERFLQGQITCDCRTLTQDAAPLAAHCNPQGRIISLFRIFRHIDGFYLNLPNDMLAIATTHLKKYSVFFKVVITDISASLTAVGTDDPRHGYRIDETRAIRFDLPLSAITEPAMEWHLTDLRRGLPMVFAATSEQFLPHSLNLPALGAVSFSKGCYTGQEIIARMEYRGQLKYALEYREGEATGKETLVESLIHNGQRHSLIILPLKETTP